MSTFAPLSPYFVKNIILSALQNLPAAALDKLAAFPKTKCSLSSIKGVLIDESNRNCQTDRRPWPRCHSQGNPPHHENPRGRPVTDNIGTVGEVLRSDGWFGQTEWVEVVHSDEGEASLDREEKGGEKHRPVVSWPSGGSSLFSFIADTLAFLLSIPCEQRN